MPLLLIGVMACNPNDKDLPPPQVFLNMPKEGYSIDADSIFTISPKITYDKSSKYEWRENNELIQNTKDLVLQNKALGEYNYTFIVSNENGSDSIHVTVFILDMVDFENSTALLNEKGYNNTGQDGAFNYKEYIQLPVINKNNPEDLTDWGGFALSKNTDRNTNDKTNQFSVYSTKGANDSKNFTVFKQHNDEFNKITFKDNNKAHKVHSIDINNSTYTYLTIKDYKLKLVEADDYLKVSLNIYGLDKAFNKSGEPETYLLVNYNNTDNLFPLKEWTSIPLSKLGLIYGLYFEIKVESSIEVDIPLYFCLDNLKIIE